MVRPRGFRVGETSLQVGRIMVLTLSSAHQELGGVGQGEGNVTPASTWKVIEGSVAELALLKDLH